jgi:hypothetical protein
VPTSSSQALLGVEKLVHSTAVLVIEMGEPSRLSSKQKKWEKGRKGEGKHESGSFVARDVKCFLFFPSQWNPLKIELVFIFLPIFLLLKCRAKRQNIYEEQFCARVES